MDKFDFIDREMRHWPGVEHRIDHHSKHPKLRLTAGGQARMVVMPGTSSCCRGNKNTIAQIRRTLRQLGLQRQENYNG